ncbi:MAG: hypothetical protein JXB30_02140 [Anaerolineae bacterium]|nr:hypothetical protein [Anaerolineae bacterium]
MWLQPRKPIGQAVARALEAGARTADLGGTHSTSEMGALIRQKMAG